MNPWGMTFSQESGFQGVEDLWVVGYRALLWSFLELECEERPRTREANGEAVMLEDGSDFWK